jgi:putative sterol carrier protein
MAKFKVSENVSVEQFFKDAVPQQFQDMIAGADMSALAGKEFKLQFNVAGKKYCLNIKDGRDVEIIEGGVDCASLAISLGESDWRDAVTGKLEGVIDRFTDPSQLANPKTLSTLLSTTGALNVELKKPDGNVMPISMSFNGGTNPEATISLTLEDWVTMQKGQTDGQSLVMSGKMSFTGDMMFLMGLQNLM